MKVRRRLAAAIAVPVAALGAALGMTLTGPAHAATAFTDTSVQATFVHQHTIAGTATVTAPGPVTVTLHGLVGDVGGFGPFPDPRVTYTLRSGGVIDGVTITATSHPTTLPTSSVVLSGDGFPITGGANQHGTVVLTASDSDGDVAVVSVPVVVAFDSVALDLVTPGVLTDEIKTVSDVNLNGPGSVQFSATDNLGVPVSLTETNLPVGLVPGNPLLPGTAVPGFYNDLAVVATDSNGAVGTGGFLLKVNGEPTPPAPVPVLSHGQATFVSPTRENVSFDTTITTWVHFQIAGPGPINGHEGWVHAIAGQLNTAVYSGLKANHTYAVFFTPVEGQGSTVQIPGTHTGHVTFRSNQP